MGGGEAGAGHCQRCGTVGAVHQLSWIYLCAKCRKVYEVEALRKKSAREKVGEAGERKPK